jgi:large subunit ribosomal protein L14e
VYSQSKWGGLKLAAMEVGRICVKTVGREAGKKCIVVDMVDKNFVLITGPRTVSGIKRRRANINHLEPTQEKIDVNRGATDEEVTEALKAADKLDEMTKTAKPTLS